MTGTTVPNDGIRPRVLFLNSCVSGGGAGRSLTAYFEHAGQELDAHVVLPEQGVIGPKIATAAELHEMPEFVERPLNPPYTRLRNLPILDLLGGIAALGVATRKIAKLARKLKPDVIYCNHMLAKPVGAMVGTLLRIPVVFHARNIHENHWLERRFYQWLGRRKAVKLILANSAATAKTYRDAAPEKVHVVHNFADLSRFDRSHVTPGLRRELNLASDTPVIGFVGRLAAWKGVGVLIEAFAQIQARFPKARLVIVGDNDNSRRRNLRAEYEALANRLGVGERTHFLGFRDDVRPVMVDFDVIALPSTAPEPFGRVLVEGMALGVPPVITAHGGAVEVVTDGVDGLWAAPNDAADFSRKLATMLTEPERRKAMGTAGAKAVRERFDGHAIAAKITRLVAEVAV